MSKIMQKPLACRNAHCGAMCSPADAEFYSKLFGDNPTKCYNYERRDDLYRNDKLLDRVKRAREEIEDNLFVAYGEYDNPQSYYEVVEVKDVLKILDKLIESEET